MALAEILQSLDEWHRTYGFEEHWDELATAINDGKRKLMPDILSQKGWKTAAGPLLCGCAQ